MSLVGLPHLNDAELWEHILEAYTGIDLNQVNTSLLVPKQFACISDMAELSDGVHVKKTTGDHG